MTEQAPGQVIEHLLTGIFEAFASGLDVSQAELFRLEGRIVAAVESGDVEASWLRRCLVALAEQHLGPEAAEIYREDQQWRLYMHMHRAPVFPSTSS